MNKIVNFRTLLGITLFFIVLQSSYTKDNVLATDDDIVNLIKVPLCRQGTDYSCGVSSLQSVLYYYYSQDSELRWVREDILAKELKTTHNNGTSYKKIAEVSKEKGLNVLVHLNMTLNELKQTLDNKRPVICAIQAWAEDKENTNYKDDWKDGHYVIAIGYDNKNIYFMDPATLGNYTYIPITEFLDRWHDIDEDNNEVVYLGIEIWKNTEPTYNSRMIRKLE